ncbi:hypothetical protein LXL04_022137 [Taraxacum kok-saghyz]
MEKSKEIVGKVSKTLDELFNHYKGKSEKRNVPNTHDNIFGENSSIIGEIDIDLELEFDKFDDGGQEIKSELEIYLADAREKRDQKFDLLGWWKANSTKFPILSKLARHVLAMPISTVASESAFSTGGRVIDKYRSSLNPETAEALICAQDWIRRSPVDLELGCAMKNRDIDEFNEKMGSLNIELAVNKPKPYRLKPKPQKLPQNRTAKITAKPYRKNLRYCFRFWLKTAPVPYRAHPYSKAKTQTSRNRSNQKPKNSLIVKERVLGEISTGFWWQMLEELANGTLCRLSVAVLERHHRRTHPWFQFLPLQLPPEPPSTFYHLEIIDYRKTDLMEAFLHEFQHLKIHLEEIKSATDNFHNSKVIGKGGFGKVYEGVIFHSKGKSLVAFKRLDRYYGQGDPEFWKEILMLSRYTHENLISLLGFCDEDGEKIIVYEHASHGSLDRYLSSTTLTWKHRLKICLGAARGLCYLHDPKETQNRVIHRDIKSSNILLDENWNAKVSDMGLSKVGPANQEHTFLVSNVVGTFGYVDPMYAEKSILTKESDVYSFGVVLFEVLCGRLCYENHNGRFQSLVRMWKQSYKQKKQHEIILQDLKQHMDPRSLETFVDIAYRCLHKFHERRPKISEVVDKLSIAIQFQEMSEEPPHTLRAFGTLLPQSKLDSIFVLDVTIHDGTIMAPRTTFTKIWRMRNNGNVIWPYGSRLQWIGGDRLSFSVSVDIKIPTDGLHVDKELNITVDMTAPERPGQYVSYWKMTSPSGEMFGQRISVSIQVDDYQKYLSVNRSPESWTQPRSI